MKKLKILFYGPVNISKDYVGGGEVGNNKTISVYRQLGHNVIVCNKPRVVCRTSVISWINYFVGLFKCIILLIAEISKSNKNGTCFHIAGFYYNQVYFEFIVASICKMFGIPYIYEVRAGGAHSAYYEKGVIYKTIFRDLLRDASNVLVQGKSYVKFLKSIGVEKAIYYPNYVDGEILGYKNYCKDLNISHHINLVYFGRIVPGKNVDIIINIYQELKRRGVKCKLTLVGSITNEYYNRIVGNFDYATDNNFVILNPMVRHELFSLLQKQHFFLFPSNEKREGHSNSLTEAMFLGVVPLVSDHGFNYDVVGDEALVIPEYDWCLYVERIYDILVNNKWQLLSSFVQSRVRANFVSNKALICLEQCLKSTL